MSDKVDTRIVEMQFDDAQFKAGVKDTIAAIKDLDNALELEDGASGFDNIAKAIKGFDISDVAKGVEQVEGKLGGLKKTAIDVVNGIGGIMKGSLWTGGIATALTSLPVVAKSITGGLNRAAKLAQSEFQFKGLGVEGEALNKIMEGVSNSVSDTAYGLDQAASIASMLFASGVQDADQLAHALMNVSNVAATFNADYNTIADVFTKVASKGRMQGEEFQQLAHQGINAKAVIADYLKTEQGAAQYWGLIEKYGATEAAITDMSKDGVIGFDLLVNAMDQFEENAKKSNDTLQGVTANIGAALSRTTADFFQFVLENKDGVVKVLNDVRVGINNINKATNVLMHNVERDLEGNVVKAGVVIEGVLKVLDRVHAALDRFNTHNSDKYGDGLSTYFHRWATLMNQVAPLIEGFFDRVASIAYKVTTILLRSSAVIREILRIIVKLIKPVAQAFDEVFGQTIVDGFRTFDKGLRTIVTTLRALNPSKAVIEGIHQAFTALFSIVKPIVDLIGGLLIYEFNALVIAVEAVFSVIDAVIQVFLAFFDAISPVTDIIAEFFGIVREESGEAGNIFLDFMRGAAKTMRKFARDVKSGVAPIKELFKPLREGAESLAKTLRESGFLDLVKGVLSKAVEDFANALANLGPVLMDLLEFLRPVGEAIADTFGKAIDGLTKFVETSGIGDFFSNIVSNISDFLGLGQAFATTGEDAEQGAEGLDEFGKRFGEAAVAARDGAIELGGRALEALVGIATTVWNVLGPALEWLFDLFGQIGGIVADAFGNSGLTWDPVIEFFTKVGELASDFFKLFEDGLPSLEDFGKFFGDIADSAGQMFDDIVPKLGSVLQDIGDQISSQTDGPLGQLAGVIGIIVENIGKLPDVISQIPSGFGKLFEGVFNGIDSFMRNPLGVQKAWAATGEETPLTGAAEAFDNMEEEALTLSTAITKITKFLKEPMDTARSVVGDGFVGFMKGIGDAINEGLSAINFEVITMFIENLKNVAVTFSSLWGTIALVSVFESIREIFVGIAKWTESIDTAINSFGNIGNAISGMFKKIGETIEGIGTAIQKDMAANRFLKYMIGTIAMIGTLVAAVVVLGRMDNGQLQQGGKAIAQILVVLLIYQALMLLISRINDNAKGAATLAGLTGMGFALLMVAKSIAKLGAMDRDELIQGGVAVGILMVVLGVMASAVGALSANGIKGAVLLITFGLLLKTLALTIGAYAIMPWDVYGNGMLKMVGVLAMLVIAARVVSKSYSNVIQGAVAMLIMSNALGIMVAAIGALSLIAGDDVGRVMLLAGTLVVSMLVMARSLTKLSAFQGSLLKASASIGLMSLCLLAVAAAIGVLNLVTLGNPVTAVVMGIVLAGMLRSMATTMTQLGNKTRQLPNATAAIFNMTIALGAITTCLAILTAIAAWNPGGLVVAAVMIGMVMGAMVLSIMAIGNYAAKIDAAIPAIWSMTLAIAAIGAAIAVLTLLGGGNIAGMAVAAGSLAATLIVMAAAIAILSKEGLKADMAATAMLELAAALAVMAVSIALLGSLEITSIVQGFVALLVVVGLLAAAALVVTALSAEFVIFDAVLIGLGIALVAISVAFYGFVAALAELAGIAPEAFQSIIDSRDKMIGAFQTMGEAIAAGIQSFFAALIFGVGTGLTGVSEEVGNHGPEIGNAAMGIGKALGEGIIFGFGGMVLGIGQAIVEGIGSAIDGVSQTVADNGGAMSYEMSQSMAEHPEWYQDAGQQTMDQFTEGAEQSEAPAEAGEEAVRQIDEAAQQAAQETDSSQIIDNLTEGMPEEFKEQFGDMLDPTMFEDLGLDLGNVIPGNILSGASASPIDPGSLMEGMNLTTASFDSNAQEVGTGIGNAVSSGAALSMADTSPVDAAVDAQIGAIQGRTGEYQTSGEQSGQAYSQGVNTGITGTDINPAVVANTAKMAAALGPAKTAGEGAGRMFSTGEMSGIASMVGAVASTARGTMTQAGNNAGGWSAGYGPGRDFGSGMASGINSAGYAVAQAARRIVSDAMSAAKKEADSHSPSKKMIEQGQWFGQGFAIGIRQTGDLVNQNAKNMVIQAMDEVQESFGVMDTLLDMIDWDAQPTITPVLDLTDYEAGIRRMGTLSTQASVDRIGWADRVYSTPMSSGDTTNNSSNHIEVHLDWHAGQTANQMAQQLAKELETLDLMEA